MHHPRFLEWVGAPETARLLNRPPAEWLQVMNCRDTLHAALQLQRDASPMSSNLTVLHQYAIALHRMSTLSYSTRFSARSSSLWERSTTLRRCPACFGRPPIWQLWAFGDPRLVRWSHGRECRPVGSLSWSSRTASLHRFIMDLVDE